MKGSDISGTLTATSAPMPGPLHDCHSKNQCGWFLQFLWPQFISFEVFQMSWNTFWAKGLGVRPLWDEFVPCIAFYYFHLRGAVPTPLLPTAPLSAMSHSSEFLFGYFPCQCVHLADIVKMSINVLVSWPSPAPCIQSWFVSMCIWAGAGEGGTEWMASWGLAFTQTSSRLLKLKCCQKPDVTFFLTASLQYFVSQKIPKCSTKMQSAEFIKWVSCKSLC